MYVSGTGDDWGVSVFFFQSAVLVAANMEFLRLTLWQVNSQRQRLGSVLFDKIERKCLHFFQMISNVWFHFISILNVYVFKNVLATAMLECFGDVWNTVRQLHGSDGVLQADSLKAPELESRKVRYQQHYTSYVRTIYILCKIYVLYKKINHIYWYIIYIYVQLCIYVITYIYRCIHTYLNNHICTHMYI